MRTFSYVLRKSFYAIPLILGVTFISFLLMVYFGPDKTYDLLGKNPTAKQIEEVRHELGYDRPFVTRYVDYLKSLFSFDFGNSDSSGEKVSSLLGRAVPVTFALTFPGFLLGELLAILLGMLSAARRGEWIDKLVMAGSVIGMSISLVIIVIVFQVLFCSSEGLGIFPVSGWEMGSVSEYLHYVTVPTLVSIFIGLGYNTRFFRAIFVEEIERDHIRTAKAYGAGGFILYFKHVLGNCMVPIITRTVFSIPYLIIGGTLVIESYFSIPGVGLITYKAVTSGDQPVVKALVGVTVVFYVFCLLAADFLYQVFDPRISLR